LGESEAARNQQFEQFKIEQANIVARQQQAQQQGDTEALRNLSIEQLNNAAAFRDMAFELALKTDPKNPDAVKKTQALIGEARRAMDEATEYAQKNVSTAPAAAPQGEPQGFDPDQVAAPAGPPAGLANAPAIPPAVDLNNDNTISSDEERFNLLDWAIKNKKSPRNGRALTALELARAQEEMKELRPRVVVAPTA